VKKEAVGICYPALPKKAEAKNTSMSIGKDISKENVVWVVCSRSLELQG